MKIYAWWPDGYGEWAFVLAASPEQAKILLLQTKHKDFSGEFDPEWSKDYHHKMVDEMLKKEPTVIEPGVVTFGEVA